MRSDILSIIIFVINLILWIILFRKFKKQFSSDAILENIRLEIDKLLTEINRETDRDLTLVDGKIAELKKVMEDAERRINLAIAEENKKQNEKKVLSSIKNRRVGVNFSAGKDSHQKPAEQYLDFIDESVSASPVVVETRNEPLVEKTEKERAAVQPEKPELHISYSDNPVKVEKSLRGKVLELWGQGFTAEIIAERLSVSITEIQMIIEMFG